VRLFIVYQYVRLGAKFRLPMYIKVRKWSAQHNNGIIAQAGHPLFPKSVVVLPRLPT
jgi:hypothetical protein